MKRNGIAVGVVLALLAQHNASMAAEKHSHAHGAAEQQAPEALAATTYCCPMHPEAVSDVPGSCPKCGMNLAIKGGEHAHREPTILASFKSDQPLQIGAVARTTLRLLWKDGTPVLLSDLRVAHTEKIHLLIIDSSLKDYHHEHPKSTGTDGEYSFSFTPRKPGAYRVWADLLPEKSGLQEYAVGDIEASTAGEPLTDRSLSDSVVVEGLTYRLTWDKPEIRKGEAVMGKLMVTGADGQPFQQLEPIMGTYAHLVGFSEDFQTVVHIHPMGKEPEAPTDRGGPSLDFHLMPEEPGFIRLFAQVQIGGSSKFAPFGLLVKPVVMESEGGHAEAKAAMAIPDSLEGVKEELKKHQGELHQVIRDHKLAEVHHHAFAIRDIANALSKYSSELSEDNAKKLTTWLAGVAASAEKLDEYGDGGDQAGTEKEAARMDVLLSSIEKLYPAQHAAAVVYTCPMHPEVTADKLGKCPKCGMNLDVKQ